MRLSYRDIYKVCCGKNFGGSFSYELKTSILKTIGKKLNGKKLICDNLTSDRVGLFRPAIIGGVANVAVVGALDIGAIEVVAEGRCKKMVVEN